MSKMELLSLKWNNHKSTFFHVLRDLRAKETYTDVTLACEGKFFPVHKLVLATCSDYFAEVFEKTTCKAPVVIINGIDVVNLQYLLDYMYLGEVDVPQTELASLIKAAEGLQIKGLAVPDEDPSATRKPHTAEPSPPRKRRRTHSSESYQSPRPRSKSSNRSLPQEDNSLPLIPVDTIKLEEEQTPSPPVTKEEESTAHMENTDMKDFEHMSYDEESNPGEGCSGEAGSFNYPEESSQQEWDPKDMNNSQQRTQQDDLGTGSTEKNMLRRTLDMGKLPACSICGKICVTPSILERHMRKHTGQKPYKCHICGKGFSQTGNLNRHVQRHERKSFHDTNPLWK